MSSWVRARVGEALDKADSGKWAVRQSARTYSEHVPARQAPIMTSFVTITLRAAGGGDTFSARVIELS